MPNMNMMTVDETAGTSRANDPAVAGWNVLATSKNREQAHLARTLRRFGDFRWSPYLGVLIGRVEDHEAFFDQLRLAEEHQPGFLFPLARLVPLDRTFAFEADRLVRMLKAEALTYAGRIASGTFYVRVERRGHKSEVHSQQIEQELDRAVIEQLTNEGCTPRVDFKDPDLVVVIELVGEECGVGCITRSLRERYPFVKVP
jgi:tRNA(Ser,Leu) C12 N-acetylase TAN1